MSPTLCWEVVESVADVTTKHDATMLTSPCSDEASWCRHQDAIVGVAFVEASYHQSEDSPVDTYCPAEAGVERKDTS